MQHSYYADIDLAISAQSLKLCDWLAIQNALEKINTLLPIDVVWLEKINLATKTRVLREGKILYERS